MRCKRNGVVIKTPLLLEWSVGGGGGDGGSAVVVADLIQLE